MKERERDREGELYIYIERERERRERKCSTVSERVEKNAKRKEREIEGLFYLTLSDYNSRVYALFMFGSWTD